MSRSSLDVDIADLLGSALVVEIIKVSTSDEGQKLMETCKDSTEFLRDLISHSSVLNESEWNAMSLPAQQYANKTALAINAQEKNLPVPPDIDLPEPVEEVVTTAQASPAPPGITPPPAPPPRTGVPEGDPSRPYGAPAPPTETVSGMDVKEMETEAHLDGTRSPAALTVQDEPGVEATLTAEPLVEIRPDIEAPEVPSNVETEKNGSTTWDPPVEAVEASVVVPTPAAPKELKAAKRSKRGAVTHLVREIVVLNPTLTKQQIQDAVKEKGIVVSSSTVDVVFYEGRNVMKILQDHGLLILPDVEAEEVGEDNAES